MTKLTASVPIFEKENESSGTDGDVVDETDEADDTEVIFLNSRERYVDAMVAASNNDKVVYDGEWKIPKRFRSDVMSNPVEEIKRFSTDAMVAHLGGSSDFTADFDSILTSKEKDITMAYKKAMHLMQWWKEVDRDHDRCINEKELRAAFPSSGTAKELVDLLDSDGDRLLTFTEVAWVLCNALFE